MPNFRSDVRHFPVTLALPLTDSVVSVSVHLDSKVVTILVNLLPTPFDGVRLKDDLEFTGGVRDLPAKQPEALCHLTPFALTTRLHLRYVLATTVS